MTSLRSRRRFVSYLLNLAAPMILFSFAAPSLLVAQQANAVSMNQLGELSSIHVPEGFTVERIYDVPENQGSWVSIAVAGDGQLITSDQYGSFYQIALPTHSSPISVKPLSIDLGMAQGLLFAFDSLYAMVNDEQGTSGLYRARDLDNDGNYEEVQRLISLDGSGEHGPHAVIPSPDGKWLYICAGNMTKLPELTRSWVPQVWQEDILIDRIWDPRGHAVGIMAPGGWICRVSPDGSQCELVAIGFRNEYDIAFDQDGNLFTFDADMEWDIGTAWYRPTRILHVIPGADFGWRGGTGKWPDYQIDTLPAVVNVGPGSPTGIVFGDASKFPSRYRKALFASDWSHGKIVALHLQPDGVSFSGDMETFVTAAALPVTDITIHPYDGAMYFTTGGRRLTSSLYRVQYTGADAGESRAALESLSEAPRRKMPPELTFSEHAVGLEPDHLDKIWPHLSDPDRCVRFAARNEIELMPLNQWQTRALAEQNSTASLELMVALIRHAHPDQLPRVMQRLREIDWNSLDQHNKLALLRAYGLAFLRLGPPDLAQRQEISSRFQPLFPSQSPILDRELSRLLAYVKADGFVPAAIKHLQTESTTAEKSHYLFLLSVAGDAFSDQELREYFQQLIATKQRGGGKSYGGYMDAIAQRVFDHLSVEQRQRLAGLMEGLKQIGEDTAANSSNAPLVRHWSTAELKALGSQQIVNRDLANGRRAFVKANCITCHQVGSQGGAQGPDLTTVGARLTPLDVITSVAEPNREISDQYSQYQFELRDGRIVQGRIVDLSQDLWMIGTDMMNPGLRETVKISDVNSVQRMKVSLMPEGLLDVLTEEEILDLLAYLAQHK